MIRIRILLPVLIVLIYAAATCAGQSAPGVAPGNATETMSAPRPGGRFSRWLDLNTGTLGARYKDAATSNSPWIYQFQYQFLARGRIKFDRNGSYYAGFRLSTGDYFSFSWNSTGIGAGDFTTNVYLKELFFSAAPRNLFELQFGGIGINRGESTEITTYSNNGYLMGERLSVRHPEKLFFDEISATGAYAGDINTPGVFSRSDRLAQMNYHQFLVSKRIREGMSLSADYTSQDGIGTLRQAFKLSPKRTRILDAVLYENYQRLEFHPAWGYALSIQKKPTQRLALVGGFVNIDKYYPYLNSDKLGRGKRIYITASYNFWREFSAGIVAGKAFANSFPVNNAARFDLVVSYDFLKALKRIDVL